MKILIAEDDKLSSLILRKTLETMGHEVIVTSDGLDAWQRIEQEEIPLVISDWMMPRMDGLELSRRIRETIRAHYTYIILLTARQQRRDRIEGLQAGADDFLVKPLDRGELMARVNVALRILTMQDELRRRTLDLEKAHAELKQRNALLAEIAVSDALTGLKNRRHFHETLDKSISFSLRQELPLSLVMLDVDQFKPYNDVHGHPAGDAVLIDLATLLRENAREYDLVARYGGEEFVILLPATDGPSAVVVCERLRSRLAAHPWPLRPVTASFGIATLCAPGTSASQLVSEADQALYHSKRRGRDRVTHFHTLPLALAI